MKRSVGWCVALLLLLLAIAIAIVIVGPASRAAEGPPADRPNVLLIVSDDQGAADAGCYGAKDLRTPAIDGLAARGVRFTQFYAAAPVCSPSRAALLTGRYPLRAGLPGNAPSEPGAAGGMPGEQVTLAETLRAAGYATAHVGKWHMGYTRETMPNAQGFDHSFGHMGGCIDNYSHFFYWAGPNRHDLHRNGVEVHMPGRFFGDLVVEETARFMEANRDRPLFAYVALNMPHYPYQGDPKWLEHYKGLPSPRREYAAFISTLDERIGAILKKVDDLGLRQRTLVIFQSDNGHSTEQRAFFGGGSAGIYRGAKFSLLEGGIRLPAIVSWPGRLPEGQVRDQMVHACDWVPTIGELAGVKLLNEDIDGRSIAAVIRSARAPSPHDVLHWHMGGARQANAQWAVRQGPWKLIGNLNDTSVGGPGARPLPADDRKLFLSNLAEDVSEKRNWAKDQPEVVQRLLRLHEQWLAAQRG